MKMPKAKPILISAINFILFFLICISQLQATTPAPLSAPSLTPLQESSKVMLLGQVPYQEFINLELKINSTWN